jgi:hypothetical protein
METAKPIQHSPPEKKPHSHPKANRKTTQNKKPNHPTTKTWDGRNTVQPTLTKEKNAFKSGARKRYKV